jgi:hypothetical protein
MAEKSNTGDQFSIPRASPFPTHTVDFHCMIVGRDRSLSSGKLRFANFNLELLFGGRPSKVLEVSQILVVYTLNFTSGRTSN